MWTAGGDYHPASLVEDKERSYMFPPLCDQDLPQ